MNLTPKQRKILILIRDSRLTRGYSPTMQELADELNVSKVTVFEHVEALIKKGALIRDANKARSLTVSDACHLPDEQRSTRLPLVGSIAAGVPIEAIEDREYLDLDELFDANTGRGQSTGETFVLRVNGDSMIGEQICDSDYVICRRTSTARNGETVVALLADGEATLKKFYKERGQVRLQPANEAFEPIFVDQVEIQGVVIGVVRSYR
ncbi:MAG: repressor LexA [Planctomycetaceae bacterium]|jgi:repressor LexA|nr:repressor LexA [Planctomycetaceae bacterium]